MRLQQHGQRQELLNNEGREHGRLVLNHFWLWMPSFKLPDTPNSGDVSEYATILFMLALNC